MNKISDNSKYIKIKVHAKAKKNEISGWQEGVLKVKVTAPAVDGKANKACIELLADYFDVKKSSVYIVKGEKSPNKLICLK